MKTALGLPARRLHWAEALIRVVGFMGNLLTFVACRRPIAESKAPPWQRKTRQKRSTYWTLAVVLKVVLSSVLGVWFLSKVCFLYSKISTFGAMGESLQSWRRFFKGAGTDICTVLEHAILVAHCDHPIEFRRRRDEIAQRLFKPACFKCPECVSLTPVEHAQVDHCIRRDGNESSGVSGGEAEALKEGIEGENQVLQEVVTIQRVLDDPDESDKLVFESLRKLELMQVTVKILKDTLIGKSVRALRKSRSSPAIGSIANRLLNQWTLLVDEWLATTEAATVAGGDAAQQAQPSSDVRRKDSSQKQKQPASEEEFKAKIEVSKRKLQEGYRQAADAKRRRAMQVLPIDDILGYLPRPKPSKQNNTRTRSHHGQGGKSNRR